MQWVQLWESQSLEVGVFLVLLDDRRLRDLAARSHLAGRHDLRRALLLGCS
jgi:hypothetical protein